MRIAGPRAAARRTLSWHIDRHKRPGESSLRTHGKCLTPNGLGRDTAPHPYGEPPGICGVLWRSLSGRGQALPRERGEVAGTLFQEAIVEIVAGVVEWRTARLGTDPAANEHVIARNDPQEGAEILGRQDRRAVAVDVGGAHRGGRGAHGGLDVLRPIHRGLELVRVGKAMLRAVRRRDARNEPAHALLDQGLYGR